MPLTCSAVNCHVRHSKDSGISFHKFPKDPTLRRQWVIAMKRDRWTPTKYSSLCSKHFQKEEIIVKNGHHYVKENSIPSIFNFPSHLQPRAVKERTIRHKSTSNSDVLPEETPSTNESIPLVQVRKIIAVSDHSYGLPNAEILKKRIYDMEDAIGNLKRKLNRGKTTIWRRNRKVISLKEANAGLARRIANKDATEILTGTFGDMLSRLRKKKSKQEYSAEEKQFALTVHFYSSKAYGFLRAEGFPLPVPSTLRKWASRIGGRPGFTEESFAKLAALPKPLLCCLMFDEMSIKKGVEWDGKQSVGFCDLGFGDLEHDDLPHATEALVFMVTGINQSFKLPVGYSLTNGTTADIKCNLIRQYLIKLDEVGVTCIAMTCDGTATNLTTQRQLGSRALDSGQSACSFPHPVTSIPVHCFLDAAHMVKLVRNCLAEKKEVSIRQDDGTFLVAKWEHIERLHHVQQQEGLHLGNKLKKSHIEWQRQKMKVRLATQVFSQSVADALRFLQNLGVKGFEDCEGTIMFCERFNDAFDVLNSCHPMAKYTKAAIYSSNAAVTLGRVEVALKFLSDIFVDGVPAISSKRKTAFIGLQMDLISVREIARQYVWENNTLKFLLTKKFSQDHLELFFSTIRNRGGNLNNPTALQFLRSYRKTLVARVAPSASANCEVNDTLLLVSEVQQESNHLATNIEEEHNYRVPDYEPLSIFVDNVMAYIAGWITRGLRKSLKCSECLDYINSGSVSAKLIGVKNRGGLIHPNSDIINMCVAAEQVLRKHCTASKLSSRRALLECLVRETFALAVERNIMRNNEHLFTSSEPGAAAHYTALVKDTLLAFFNLRLRHLARLHSEELRGSSIRQKLTKLILFKGQ